MEHRQLGRTGVSVSKFVLARRRSARGATPTMTSRSGSSTGARRRHQLHRHRRRLRAGRDRGDRRQGARRRPRHDSTSRRIPQRDGRGTNERGNLCRWIIREVEDSLRRLGTDWIDLYQVHRIDPRTDVEETLSALSDLVHQGKVRYIGSSRSRPARSSKRSGSRGTGFCSGSSPSSRRTRCSSGPLRPTSCPRACATAWPSCPTAP